MRDGKDGKFPQSLINSPFDPQILCSNTMEKTMVTAVVGCTAQRALTGTNKMRLSITSDMRTNNRLPNQTSLSWIKAPPMSKVKIIQRVNGIKALSMITLFRDFVIPSATKQSSNMLERSSEHIKFTTIAVNKGPLSIRFPT